MKLTRIILLFCSLIGFSQNQIKVDIVSLKQDGDNIIMEIYNCPDSLANKGIQIEINVYESDYEIKTKKGYKNRFKDSVDKTTGDYDHFRMKTDDGVITTQISPISSKYYKLEVILIYPDGSKKVESKVLKINHKV